MSGLTTVSMLVLLMCTTALAAPPCTCEADRIRNGWCEACDVGYVAAVEIRSRMLFEALDAHGHDIDPASMECASCRKALAGDGFCETCRWGFVKKQLYFSRLTWVLARGAPADPSTVACRACRKNATTKPPRPIAGEPGAGPASTARPVVARGWCDPCRRGFVGNVAFTDRRDFEIAAREYARLLAAVHASRRCELCAVAMFTGASCRACPASAVDREKP